MTATGAMPLEAPTTGLGAGNDINNPLIDATDAIYVFTQSKTSKGTDNKLNVIRSGKVTSTSVAVVRSNRHARVARATRHRT